MPEGDLQAVAVSENDAGPPPRTGPPSGKKKARLRRVGWGVIGLALIAGLIVGVRYYRFALSHVSTDDAFIEGHIVPISPRVNGHVAKVHVTPNQWVERGDLLVEIDPREFEVRLEAARAALRAAEAEQRSAKINVEVTQVTSDAEVDEARAGVALAQSAVQTARARAAAARSRLEQTMTEVTVAQATEQQAKSEARAAKARAEQDDTDLERSREMFNKRTISRQELDHAEAAARTTRAALDAAQDKTAAARARVAQARAAVKVAQDSVREIESQRTEAEASLGQARARLSAAGAAPKRVAQSESRVHVLGAQIEQARAAVDQAELALSYAKIYSPVSGRVARKAVEEGQSVQTGQSLLALVPRNVWVIANFKETQLGAIRPGQPVAIAVDAYPGMVFQGRVDSIQAGTGARFSLLPPENATGNYIKVVQRVPVKIDFDRVPDFGKYLLAPGMSVVPVIDIIAPPQGRASSPPAARRSARVQPD